MITEFRYRIFKGPELLPAVALIYVDDRTDLWKLQKAGLMGKNTKTHTFYGADDSKQAQLDVVDKANKVLLDSAIQKSGLGINPQIDGQIIRLRIPDLTEERRKEGPHQGGPLSLGIKGQVPLPDGPHGLSQR